MLALSKSMMGCRHVSSVEESYLLCSPGRLATVEDDYQRNKNRLCIMRSEAAFKLGLGTMKKADD
jgi:hypothetical protein